MAKLLSKFNDSIELAYMGDVDAAMRNRGSKWAYRLSFIVFGVFIGFLVWSSLATRNEVTRGTGQVTPSLGVQPIQSETGGIIKEIFVKEGQEVKKGDRLVQMSNVEALAEYGSLRSRQIESQLALKRLDAELSGAQVQYTQEEQELYPDMVGDQVRLYVTRKERFESGNREIAANIEQKRRSVEEALTRKTHIEKSLLLSKQQAARVWPLVQQKVHPEIEYINLRQRIVGLEGDLNALAEAISRTQSELKEEETRLVNRDSEWQATVTAERNEYRRQLNTINERLAAGSHMVDISELRAPMNGVIKQIRLKEESVAQRAEPIMELLPSDDTLEVDARFQPQYRGYLEEGMPALVKIDAYDFTIYGALPAKVIRISPDTIEDTKGQAWFEMRLQTESGMVHEGKDLEIKPGMTVTVDVISGDKSILGYIMKPFIKSQVEGKAVGTKSSDPSEELRPVIPAPEEPEQGASDVSPVDRTGGDATGASSAVVGG